MRLDLKTGKLSCHQTDITPPKFFEEKFEEDLRQVLPSLHKSSGDYQRWQWFNLKHESVTIQNEFKIHFCFCYKWDWTKDEHPRLLYLYVNFTEGYLNNEIFKEDSLRYNEKLKKVKCLYLKLLQALTRENLKMDKRNVISFPWGRARIDRKKKIFYELTLYWD